MDEAEHTGKVVPVEEVARFESKERAKTWWAVFTAVVCISAAMIFSVLYANSVDRESNRRWCGVVTTLDDAYNQSGTRPQSQIGLDLAREIRQLRIDFGC